MDDIKLGNSNILDIVSKLNSLNSSLNYSFHTSTDDNWKELDILNTDKTKLWGLEFNDDKVIQHMYNSDGIELYFDTYINSDIHKLYLCVDKPIDCVVTYVTSNVVLADSYVDKYIHNVTIKFNYDNGDYPDYSVLRKKDSWGIITGNKGSIYTSEAYSLIHKSTTFTIKLIYYNSRLSKYTSFKDLINDKGNLREYPNHLLGYVVYNYDKEHHIRGSAYSPTKYNINICRSIVSLDLYSGDYLKLGTIMPISKILPGHGYSTTQSEKGADGVYYYNGSLFNVDFCTPSSGFYEYLINLNEKAKEVYNVTITDNVTSIAEVL